MNLPYTPNPKAPESGDQVTDGDGYLEVVRVESHDVYSLVVLRRLDRDFRATGEVVPAVSVETWAGLVRRRGGE